MITKRNHHLTVPLLQEHCASLPGAEDLLHAAPVNVLSYKIGDKTFAYFKTSAPEQWRFSFRATPDRFLELTGMPGVKPARYMGRFHWVTIVDVSRFPQDYLLELVQWSYDKAFSALPKARQRELSARLKA
jgi:predicted DNA-binding protein (MmcQ/YjbR family)